MAAKMERERDRDRQRDRQTERDRQTDRQTDSMNHTSQTYANIWIITIGILHLGCRPHDAECIEGIEMGKGHSTPQPTWVSVVAS